MGAFKTSSAPGLTPVANCVRRRVTELANSRQQLVAAQLRPVLYRVAIRKASNHRILGRGWSSVVVAQQRRETVNALNAEHLLDLTTEVRQYSHVAGTQRNAFPATAT